MSKTTGLTKLLLTVGWLATKQFLISYLVTSIRKEVV